MLTKKHEPIYPRAMKYISVSYTLYFTLKTAHLNRLIINNQKRLEINKI